MKHEEGQLGRSARTLVNIAEITTTYSHISKVDDRPADILSHIWYSIYEYLDEQDKDRVHDPSPYPVNSSLPYIYPFR